MEVSRGGEKKRERDKEREREKAIKPTCSALLPHTRANPLVFGFSGKTAPGKGETGE